jgi:excisionase family DNA binding protein
MGDPEPLQDSLAGSPLLLTPEEAAALLRIGRTTVYALMKAGELRSVHIGRSCRLSHAEVERYVHSLQSPAPPSPARRECQGRRRTSTEEGGPSDLVHNPPDVP